MGLRTWLLELETDEGHLQLLYPKPLTGETATVNLSLRAFSWMGGKAAEQKLVPEIRNLLAVPYGVEPALGPACGSANDRSFACLWIL